MQLFHQKDGLDKNGKIQFQFRQLLTVAYPHFNQAQKAAIDQIVLSIQSKHEAIIFNDINNKIKHNLSECGRLQFLYLSAIPESEVMKRSQLKKRFQELQRKFGSVTDTEPNKISVRKIGPPMTRSAYDMGTDIWKV